jgi:hypothetical protein
VGVAARKNTAIADGTIIGENRKMGKVVVTWNSCNFHDVWAEPIVERNLVTGPGVLLLLTSSTA